MHVLCPWWYAKPRFASVWIKKSRRLSTRFFGGTTQNRTGDKGFADPGLTAWRWCHIKNWSGRRDSRRVARRASATNPQAGHKRYSLVLCQRHKRIPSLKERERLSTCLERETGFGPATFALARQRSTTEPLPRAIWIYHILCPIATIFCNFSKKSAILMVAIKWLVDRRAGEWYNSHSCRCGEMVDARDLKSLGVTSVPVRVRSPAPYPNKTNRTARFVLFYMKDCFGIGFRR